MEAGYSRDYSRKPNECFPHGTELLPETRKNEMRVNITSLFIVSTVFIVSMRKE